MSERSIVRMPTITSATPIVVEQVLVTKGERVESVQPLVEVQVDKATITIPAPGSGIVVQVFVAQGDVIRADDPLVTLTDSP
ncbi:MAG TPA: biotin/lipoyl-containing protein [Pirellulales bacterium]